MKRIAFAFLLATMVAGCVDAPHHGKPPQDPPDYHGVPTDDRPPAMIDTPAAPQ
ncbi:membrane lipoprotein lipid attachment site-containing protein [Trinickia violacea]|uniref:membrane lipoprotein lipid attachment site-containing protein n=1 Tax=Trinickia violacea TaxID=2571746 RepID=UPI001586C7F5|nr:membrane lipoprotein lipid attachment site-containing protein [Trinickia violacea]